MAEAFIAWNALHAFEDFEENLMDLDEIEEQRAMRRVLRDVTNPFECPERAFRSYFRLSRELAWDLCEWLRPHLQRERGHGLAAEKQVLAALRFFATGSNQGAVAQDLNISFSQTSISRAIKAVSLSINNTLLRDFIKFPNTPEERQHAKAKFLNAAQPFIGAIGAIDCTHVPIIAPREHEEAHLNHHGFHSMNVQVVCDPSFKILQICARYPGARHDAFIWNASPLRDNMIGHYIAGERGTWLLGDSGYPEEPWLFTPVVNAAPGTPEFRYTEAHCKSRAVIERCFGILKGVWGCLSRKRILLYDPVAAGRIINACAVLHNLRLLYNIQPEDDELDDLENAQEVLPPREEGPERGIIRDRLAEARRIRGAFIRQHFA